MLAAVITWESLFSAAGRPGNPTNSSSASAAITRTNPSFFSGLRRPPPPTAKCGCATATQQHSFTVSYLIDSCGLSPERALFASRKVRFEDPRRPDAVIALFERHGFSKSQICKLVSKRPSLLLAKPQQTLAPKLQFFLSIGVSESDLARALALDPTVLTRSLENRIIPSYNFLKSILQSDRRIAASIRRTSWSFVKDLSQNLAPNVALLRQIEVPETCIALLLTHFPEALLQKNAGFCLVVERVRDMGFDPLKTTFVLAIHAVSGKGRKRIWDRCCQVYGRWGWSDEEISSAFKKHPHCMLLSEKKITRGMDFFVNRMGLSAGSVARSPICLFLSLEKRIIPRCRVVQALCSKGLLFMEDVSLGSLLLPVERLFLRRYVTKFQHQVPQLLRLYQGNVGVLEE